MTRARALTSTFRFVIALLTAILVSILGTSALPAAALPGNGAGQSQAERGSADRAQQDRARPEPASKAQSSGKAQKPANAQEPAQAQKPAQAQETQPNRGQSAQAPQSETSQAASGSRPAGRSDHEGGDGDQGDPPGNNGTVKLANFDAPNGPGHSSGNGNVEMHPSNDPHLPCDFSVEWFGFDSGVTSEVTFEQHAPTRSERWHHDSVALDNDSHGGGGSTAGYDGVANYNLDFEGDPHPKHGYHVKLTTETPYSQGSDRKHKVFWVEPCEEEADVPEDEDETDEDETDQDETDQDETDQDETDQDETDEEENQDDNGVQDTVEENGGNTSTVVFGAQASIQSSQGAQAAAEAPAAAAEVPTAVASGLTGDAWSRSVLPLLIVLFGLGTTFVALVRRRARVQAVTRD
jgi:hypothetical protein